MKILYVTTISNTVNAFLIPHIKMLIDEGHQVDLAFNIKQEVKQEIIDMGCKIHKILFQRSPISKDNFSAYKILKNIIIDEGYDLVHTHTPIASVCVRLACRKIKNVKVLYTAHGFHFFKGAPIINWLIYYPIEWWLAKYTDVLITINQEDYKRAKKSFKAGRIEYVTGVGIDIKKINESNIGKSEKRKELGVPMDCFIILSVGELNKNKNHVTALKALAKINNPEIHYLICGQGGLENYLLHLTKELGLEKQVHLLGFRKDIIEICRASDVFVFPSYREGLPVALMETMAVGLPIVCSNARGNTDLIEDGVGGNLLNPSDVDGFANAIEKLKVNKQLLIKFSKNNLKEIDKYSIKNVITQMERIYDIKRRV